MDNYDNLFVCYNRFKPSFEKHFKKYFKNNEADFSV